MTDSSTLQRLVTAPRAVPLAALAASAATLGSAWGFQLIGGLAPCTLCLYQRWPYWAAIAIALAAMAAAPRLGRAGMAWIAVLFAAVFLACAAVAAFHVGVEQHWWPGLASCGGSVDANMSFDELKAQLLAAPIVRCDEVPWSLFGISLAGYNLVISIVLATASGWAATSLYRASRSEEAR